ncbi:MAG: hypothetical protein AB7Y74_15095 [Syntrophorhabdus sp.]
MTDRNWIGGSYDRTREHEVSKSISIKGYRCKSSRCAVKVIGITPGGLRFCPLTRTEGNCKVSRPKRKKSAEGIVPDMQGRPERYGQDK